MRRIHCEPCWGWTRDQLYDLSIAPTESCDLQLQEGGRVIWLPLNFWKPKVGSFLTQRTCAALASESDGMKIFFPSLKNIWLDYPESLQRHASWTDNRFTLHIALMDVLSCYSFLFASFVTRSRPLFICGSVFGNCVPSSLCLITAWYLLRTLPYVRTMMTMIRQADHRLLWWHWWH